MRSHILHGVSGPKKAIAVLVASGFEQDLISLRAILHGPDWRVVASRTCTEALSLLRQHHFDVIVCDRDLPGGGWKAMLHQVALFRPRPSLIVSSRVADERLWTEVLNLGGYDLLPTPFEATEVSRVVFLAWNHRNRETLPISAARKGPAREDAVSSGTSAAL